MIEITVTRRLQCSVEDVYAELEDCSKYHEWWPIPVEPMGTDGRAVRVRPLPFVRIVLVQTSVETNEEVRYRYTDGPFRGVGTWTIQSVENGAPVSKVRYSVHLKPVNYLVEILSSTSLFRRKHETDVSRIMDQLGRRCSRNDGELPQR